MSDLLSPGLQIPGTYAHAHTLSASRKPSGRFLMVSVVDIIQRFLMVSVVGFFMVSVVAGNVFNGFRRWFFYGFRRGSKNVVFCFV